MTDSEKQLYQQPLPTEDAPETEDDGSFTNNYGMAIALGLPFGALIGLIFFDNLALGAGLGLVIAPIVAMMMSSAKS